VFAPRPRLQPDIGRHQRGDTAERDLEIGQALATQIVLQHLARKAQLTGHRAKPGIADPREALISSAGSSDFRVAPIGWASLLLQGIHGSWPMAWTAEQR
jgi:hypothetical protein